MSTKLSLYGLIIFIMSTMNLATVASTALQCLPQPTCKSDCITTNSGTLVAAQEAHLQVLNHLTEAIQEDLYPQYCSNEKKILIDNASNSLVPSKEKDCLLQNYCNCIAKKDFKRDDLKKYDIIQFNNDLQNVIFKSLTDTFEDLIKESLTFTHMGMKFATLTKASLLQEDPEIIECSTAEKVMKLIQEDPTCSSKGINHKLGAYLHHKAMNSSTTKRDSFDYSNINNETLNFSTLLEPELQNEKIITSIESFSGNNFATTIKNSLLAIEQYAVMIKQFPQFDPRKCSEDTGKYTGKKFHLSNKICQAQNVITTHIASIPHLQAAYPTLTTYPEFFAYIKKSTIDDHAKPRDLSKEILAKLIVNAKEECQYIKQSISDYCGRFSDKGEIITVIEQAKAIELFDRYSQVSNNDQSNIRTLMICKGPEYLDNLWQEAEKANKLPSLPTVDSNVKIDYDLGVTHIKAKGPKKTSARISRKNESSRINIPIDNTVAAYASSLKTLSFPKKEQTMEQIRRSNTKRNIQPRIEEAIDDAIEKQSEQSTTRTTRFFPAENNQREESATPKRQSFMPIDNSGSALANQSEEDIDFEEEISSNSSTNTNHDKSRRKTKKTASNSTSSSTMNADSSGNRKNNLSNKTTAIHSNTINTSNNKEDASYTPMLSFQTIQIENYGEVYTIDAKQFDLYKDNLEFIFNQTKDRPILIRRFTDNKWMEDIYICKKDTNGKIKLILLNSQTQKDEKKIIHKENANNPVRVEVLNSLLSP